MKKHECPGCGSIYAVSFHNSDFREDDSFDCEVCGHKIIKWKGHYYYAVRLIERKEISPPRRPTSKGSHEK